jgi:hypothetical protein
MEYTQVIRNLAWLETAQNEVHVPSTKGPVAAIKFFIRILSYQIQLNPNFLSVFIHY